MEQETNLEQFLTLMKGKPLGPVINTRKYLNDLSQRIEEKKRQEKNDSGDKKQ